MPNYFSKQKYPDSDHVKDAFLADQRRWFERAQAGTCNLTDRHLQLMRCMFGDDGSTNELLGSNGVERAEIVRGLAEALRAHRDETGHVIARATIAHGEWSFPSFNPTVDLASIRRVTTVLKKLAPASIAAVRIGCTPVRGDAKRFQFRAVVDAVLIGADLAHSAPIAAAPLQRQFEASEYAVSPIQLSYPKTANDRVIAAAAATLLDMGDPFASVVKQRLGDRAAKSWSKAGKKRAFERLKILTLCRLDRLLLATGCFEPVLAAFRAGAQARVRRRYQIGNMTLHPDALTHFWVDPALHAADEPLSLPFVKQRK